MNILYSALLGSIALISPLVAKENLPETLKPEPHQRDPYHWQTRHEQVTQLNVTIKPEYVIIGDSITHMWGGKPVCQQFKPRAQASWDKLFGSHKVVNMGFGFDYIDNAYFRITDGELSKHQPRVIILLLGTNNIGHRKDKPQAVADNMNAMLNLLKTQCPQSKILLLSILPRQEEALRDTIISTNKAYEKLADNKKVFYLNLAPYLSTKEGTTDKQYFSDPVHINAKGYEQLVAPIAKKLSQIDPQYRPDKIKDA